MLTRSLNIYQTVSLAVFIIAASSYIKYVTNLLYRLMLSQLVYQRGRLRSSDIKRAVAFFKQIFPALNGLLLL